MAMAALLRKKQLHFPAPVRRIAPQRIYGLADSLCPLGCLTDVPGISATGDNPGAKAEIPVVRPRFSNLSNRRHLLPRTSVALTNMRPVISAKPDPRFGTRWPTVTLLLTYDTPRLSLEAPKLERIIPYWPPWKSEGPGDLFRNRALQKIPCRVAPEGRPSAQKSPTAPGGLGHQRVASAKLQPP
jgi:hypothetical protein